MHNHDKKCSSPLCHSAIQVILPEEGESLQLLLKKTLSHTAAASNAPTIGVIGRSQREREAIRIRLKSQMQRLETGPQGLETGIESNTGTLRKKLFVPIF